MIKLSTRNLGYCHKCDLNSIISRKSVLHGIPIRRYWCKNRCGEYYFVPIDMTDLPELHDRIDQHREDKRKQMPLPL